MSVDSQLSQLSGVQDIQEDNQTQQVFRVGTRKSQLALVQTKNVIQMLKNLNPDVKFETLPMSTVGDKILDSALSKIGEKALFTKELENALLEKRVDFVVHSLKDLPTVLPDSLVLGCVCKRDNPYDAVVMHPKHAGKKLVDLPPGSIIGTSSLRRAAQLQRLYPDIKIESIRGNLNTRFKKMAESNLYDAIILAVAGLERLGWQQVIAQVLTPEECMYAVSQGAMAVECRSGDEKTLKLLNQIHDHQTTISCVAERAYLRQLEGGCSVPVSAFTEIEDNELIVRGGVFSVDGKESVVHKLTADLENPTEKIPEDDTFVGIYCQNPSQKQHYTAAWAVGVQLAEQMIKKGADTILAEAKAIAKKEVIAEHEKRALKRKAEEEISKEEQPVASSSQSDSVGSHSSSDSSI